jgi:malonate-semialdehyde dehydrogenase (acetylating) / methylmalonate-semialdehyde dehydrogenase
MRIVNHWINGQTVEGGVAKDSVTNPATDSAVAEVWLADDAIVDSSIDAAAAAAWAWEQTTMAKRAHVLFRFRDLLLANREELAALITAEHGKTLDDATGEVMRAAESVELACGGPALAHGITSLQSGPNIDTRSMMHPVGICIGITPFNFPIMMGLMMISVSLAAGNTFIWKPSEQDPGPSVRIAELFKEAGLPDGVLNVVHGRQGVVERLMDDPRTQAASFVGSSDVAHAVYKRAAEVGMRCQAFGGAKNHMVVMPDADLDMVADQLAASAFGAAGQRCMAISVAVVVGDGHDDLVARLKTRAEQIRLNAGDIPGTEVGPVVSRRAQERIQSLVKTGIADGATAVVDRSCEQVAGHENGYFVGPTLLIGVAQDSAVYQQEIFGPVLSVMQVDTLADAIALIRSHRYGNGASIFTNNGPAANQFTREAGAGMVGVNVAIPVPVATYAVQGWKDSAFGDTGLNNASWSFYTRPKYITSRWEDASGMDFGFRPN